MKDVPRLNGSRSASPVIHLLSRSGAMIKPMFASLVLLALFVSSPARAQLLPTQTLSLQAARTMAAAAEAEARETSSRSCWAAAWNCAFCPGSGTCTMPSPRPACCSP
jgi:hypothetical protein